MDIPLCSTLGLYVPSSGGSGFNLNFCTGEAFNHERYAFSAHDRTASHHELAEFDISHISGVAIVTQSPNCNADPSPPGGGSTGSSRFLRASDISKACVFTVASSPAVLIVGSGPLVGGGGGGGGGVGT